MASTSFEVNLDIFGQRLVVIFTQISFCFINETDHAPEDLISILERGLDYLGHSFPWLAGQVVCEGATPSNTGTFKIVPLERRPKLTIRDHRESMSMKTLQSRNFSMADLHESIVAPRNTSSGRPGETLAEVSQLQATLIDGGIILTFLGQHQALDGVGLGQVVHLFSKACRGDDFTADELRICDLANARPLELYDETWSPGLELEYNGVKVHASDPSPGRLRYKIPSEPGVWCHFNIDAQCSSQIKSLAMEHLPDGCAYISADDALSAFIWQAITRARYARLDRSTPVLFARAVDLRRCLELPQIHPGFVQSMTYHSFAADELVRPKSLGLIAANLRTALQPEDLAHHGRSFATLISRTADKTKTSYLAGFDMSRDVMLSSWTNQNSYEHDFGLGLGKPAAVRRPYFSSFPGLVYLLPKAPNGDIGVAVWLSREDMDTLKLDETFMSYVAFIG